MLQQTRVETVVPYYRRWLRAFPTIQALAGSPFDRVLKLWEGLGYYNRARNLHRAAKIILGSRPRAPKPGQGRTAEPAVPTTVEELLLLPGIGRYTAGAIASIAFDQVVPLVDGNVARVLARIFGIRSDVTKPATQKSLWSLAANLLPTGDPGTFNQALMELGALLCTPQNPCCSVCPMNLVCVANAKGQQDQLPNRGVKPPPRLVVQDAALIRRGNRILLRRRSADGLLAGLWELPSIESNRSRSHRPLVTIRHTITNHRITLRVFECEPTSKITRLNGALRWVTSKELMKLAMPAAHRRALEKIGHFRQ